MYKRGSSGEAIFELIRVPQTVKLSAGETGSIDSFVQFRRAVLREFCQLVRRQRQKAGRNARGVRRARKHVRGSR
jgi:hypothetical protein